MVRSPPPPQWSCFLILSPHPEQFFQGPGPSVPTQCHQPSGPPPQASCLEGLLPPLLLDDLGMVTAPHRSCSALGSLASPRWFLGMSHKALCFPQLILQSHKPASVGSDFSEHLTLREFPVFCPFYLPSPETREPIKSPGRGRGRKVTFKNKIMKTDTLYVN